MKNKTTCGAVMGKYLYYSANRAGRFALSYELSYDFLRLKLLTFEDLIYYASRQREFQPLNCLESLEKIFDNAKALQFREKLNKYSAFNYRGINQLPQWKP